MNNGAVITHEEKKIKGALWGAQAEFAFLDPTYTLSVPMKQVISGAFDTMSHAMETYFGKITDFQCHMIEHQLGAYTNCNHGAGLAVIHPVVYRYIYKFGAARFARWAQNVWGIAPKSSDEETALAGIKIPVTMYFGDYIDNGDPAIQATAMWQAVRQTSQPQRESALRAAASLLHRFRFRHRNRAEHAFLLPARQGRRISPEALS